MTMIDDKEERMIFDDILSLRNNVCILESRKQEADANLKKAKERLNQSEQALIDYYKSAGVHQSQIGDYSITLGSSTSVDVTDIDSVPEKYIRIKEVKEVNKALIRAERLPESNWLRYNVSDKITIKHKGA